MIYRLKNLLFAAFFFVMSANVCTALYFEPGDEWKNYRVTGTATSTSFNKGFIYDSRTAEFIFTFENKTGDRAYAPFRLHLSTVGPCIDLSLNLYFAKLAGSNLTLFDAAKNPVMIGCGIFGEVSFGAGLVGHIAGLENRPGCLILCGPLLGIGEGLGAILGGSLEMRGNPVFDKR